MKKLLSVGLAILLMASAGVFAQTSTGNIYGKATDASGAVLPGASVTISGEAGSRTTVTGADGTFRFLNLDPGDYTVTVVAPGLRLGQPQGQRSDRPEREPGNCAQGGRTDRDRRSRRPKPPSSTSRSAAPAPF